MIKKTHRTVALGDLIAAVFDEAAQYSTDPREVSRLATGAVSHLLRTSARTTRRLQRKEAIGAGGLESEVSWVPPPSVGC